VEQSKSRVVAALDGGRARRMCILHAHAAAHACIREISARSAFLETNARPPLGARVEIEHPEAGRVSGTVTMTALDGIGISFAPEPRAMGFALTMLVARMARPQD
jgi:hypothetical protein